MNAPSDSKGPSHGDADRDDASRLRECLRLLRERFPHFGGISLQLLERDETFRELCDEYAACTEVVERLKRSGSDEPLLWEYAALRLRIEAELLGHISTHRDANGL